jgi:hypothetical protein
MNSHSKTQQIEESIVISVFNCDDNKLIGTFSSMKFACLKLGMRAVYGARDLSKNKDGKTPKHFAPSLQTNVYFKCATDNEKKSVITKQSGACINIVKREFV